MLATIGSFIAPYALKIVGILAAIGAVAAVLFGARQSGRNMERVEAMQQGVKIANERRKIEQDVARTSAQQQRDELRDWSGGDKGNSM